MARYFLDENLGRSVESILRNAGFDVVTSRGLGMIGMADIEWIPRVAALGRVIITADSRIRLVPAEKAAVTTAVARLITVKVNKAATVRDVANNLVNSRALLERFIAKNAAPWIVSLSMPNERDYALGRPGRLSQNKLG